MLFSICVLLVSLAYLAHKWITRNNQYFEEKNLPHTLPKFLAFFQKNSLPDMVLRWYNEFKNEK